MPNTLAVFLRVQLTARGWRDSQLADSAGIDRSTLSNIFKNPQSVPKLETLDRLSQALNIPLARLITVCGFDIDLRGELPEEQISILLNSLPELRSVVSDLAQLQAEDLRVIQAYIQGYLHKK
ncbi:MAG TPA: XRE family transcriptional regulator [Herpetosiphon sp.]|uniref:Transcriptional regulator, XRE family n=1 Tax=Herpetosiphon aurantiacus (strain ATCC 23779 / DSM 785 / 114-95) TaxID=316274 RepID=A9B2J7_HERA2|nr:helix-turn-helix transcriptional regulator [Herpetosiphon sp.]ABX04042.1 transcriptional regulator, XRE family [Herpetosiphon aurantiacus DSM 785]HBW49241.1 XRE family transcriptional regulator [Herpetosiphon sp.]